MADDKYNFGATAKATFTIYDKQNRKLAKGSFDPKVVLQDFHDFKTCGKQGCTGCVVVLPPLPPDVGFQAEVTLIIDKWYTGEEWDRLMHPPKLIERADAEWDF